MKLEELIPLANPLHVTDIGAAYINEVPLYKPLVDRGLARLSAFDGDERQKEKLIQAYGSNVDLYTDIIADGKQHTLHLTSAAAGMSSILKPSQKHLEFFNGFKNFGSVQKELRVQSKRLDDIKRLAAIDFLKMDVQGAELKILKNAKIKIKHCVAIQLEVAFVPVYEGQPSFGEVDIWMRFHGYLPHCFVEVKKWSITPTIRDGNFRVPFNQLKEADILYVKDPLKIHLLSSEQIKKLAYISFYMYNSNDLAIFFILELEKRDEIPFGSSLELLS